MNGNRKILQVGAGRLSCLAIVLGGPFVRLSQAGQSWSDVENLGRPPSPIALYQPSFAVGQNQDGRLEAFVVDGDGNLQHAWQR